jgi:hypothetical protein
LGKIARLPPDLADQIAAGEVVERPASVIKELVENAIDAGARRIVITVEQGGKRLIRVEDDGEGMDAADAALAVERHATSKIRTSDDLGRIATLGFRGEALPAVASVSHFTLRTKPRDVTAGVEVTVDGGAPAWCGGQNARRHLDRVRDLFYNLPARRKFQVRLGGDGPGHTCRHADGAVLRHVAFPALRKPEYPPSDPQRPVSRCMDTGRPGAVSDRPAACRFTVWWPRLRPRGFPAGPNTSS